MDNIWQCFQYLKSQNFVTNTSQLYASLPLKTLRKTINYAPGDHNCISINCTPSFIEKSFTNSPKAIQRVTEFNFFI